MSTRQETIDFLLDQLSALPGLRTRKMFGEYALYASDKFGERVVAFVFDDDLFIKPTNEGREFIGTPDEAPAYPGSKLYFRISGDRWEDRDWLAELVGITTAAIPPARPPAAAPRRRRTNAQTGKQA